MEYSKTQFEKQDPDSLVNEADASNFLAMTPRALQAWRQRGEGPQFVRISSRAVRYRRGDLIEWIMDRRKSSTSEA